MVGTWYITVSKNLHRNLKKNGPSETHPTVNHALKLVGFRISHIFHTWMFLCWIFLLACPLKIVLFVRVDFSFFFYLVCSLKNRVLVLVLVLEQYWV